MSSSRQPRADCAHAPHSSSALRWLLVLLAILFLSGCGLAYLTEEPIPRSNKTNGFSGRVVDAENGEGVGNAKIVVQPLGVKTAGRPFYIYSGGDGSFLLLHFKRKGITAQFEEGEEYQIIISSVTHRIREFSAVFEGGEQKLGAIELLRVDEGGDVEAVIPGVQSSGQTIVVGAPRRGPPVP